MVNEPNSEIIRFQVTIEHILGDLKEILKGLPDNRDHTELKNAISDLEENISRLAKSCNVHERSVEGFIKNLDIDLTKLNEIHSFIMTLKQGSYTPETLGELGKFVKDIDKIEESITTLYALSALIEYIPVLEDLKYVINDYKKFRSKTVWILSVGAGISTFIVALLLFGSKIGNVILGWAPFFK